MASKRAITYVVFAIILSLGSFFLRNITWQGGAELHTLMEGLATLLALFVGAMALVRFYTRKTNVFLLIGTSFLGTGLLDGYHAIVTSTFFSSYFPSALPSLVPWSWIASRLFLSFLLWLSWQVWKREAKAGEEGGTHEQLIYLAVGALTLASFLFFALVPLPRAYYPEWIFHRPQEFVPALFFLLALIGYVRKGHWKHDAFEHWLVLSLIVGLVGQAMFMSFSGRLFDQMFDAAHLLKKGSYVLVLAGLMISMYHLFRRQEEGAQEIIGTNELLQGEIAERQQAEETLHQYEHIVSSSSDMMALLDEKFIYLSVNPAYVDAFAKTRDEFVGRTAAEVFGHEVFSKVIESNARRCLSGETITYQEWFNFPVYGERYMEINYYPYIDTDNRVKGFVVSGRNITARKRAEEQLQKYSEQLEEAVEERTSELQNAQEQLVRREKLAVLGQLAGGVGHELRNPLGVINNAAYYLQTILSDADETTREYPGIIAAEVQGAEKIVSDLLDFSRIKLIDREETGVQELVTQSLARNPPPERVQVASDFPSDLPLAWVDPRQIEQVLANIITNAFQAMPDAGRLTIRARAVSERVAISATDTGCGVSVDNLGKLFEPLFTTKARGIGLGLAMCRNLVEANGGTIEVDSQEGRGSTFTIFLPTRDVKT